MVYVMARVTCSAGDAYIVNNNYALIPEWAIPVDSILYTNSAGLKILQGSSTVVKVSTGSLWITISEEQKKISTVVDNTSSDIERSFVMNLCYPVD